MCLFIEYIIIQYFFNINRGGIGEEWERNGSGSQYDNCMSYPKKVDLFNK
mgnify:CR=1 FL=1